MPTITWNKFHQCLISSGFTEEQKEVIAEFMPYGFVDKLRSVGLNPKTFKLMINEKPEEKEEAQEQIPIFGDNQ